ncbi:MAG: NupC/NupG family nucleoside CNT transporter [Robiginitomaculum sp.]|nr:NupC/NupG family nucleoside CNT transporter [Robiginitomaculum sp.]MDQ7077763.1 NupC/NupG family nucleoside CNT transporter [Robiginitomaculum sp.]
MFVTIIGIVVLLGLAVALSDNRGKINLRVVGAAFALQASIAVFVLYIPFGKGVLSSISNGVQVVIDFSKVGINFVFGGLATSPNLGFVFAVQVLPVIIFIGSLTAVLYHLHIMQWVVKIFGGALRFVIGTSRVESLCASANIFLGQTEAPLVIRPYISRLTDNQLFTVMVSGLASVSGAILAGYALLGVNIEYLIAASFMAAPGGLLMAKIIRPDVGPLPEEHVELTDTTEDDEDRPANVIDAAALGASEGLRLAANIGAMLIAFVALIALLNGLVGGVAGLFGFDGITMNSILGWIFSPLMYLLGIPWDEAMAAGDLIGQKLVLNEFVAYASLAQVQESLSPHTVMVVTFALCGFANLSSLGILLGGLGGLAPERRGDISRMGMKAIAAGSLSNLMSAALASMLVTVG